MTAMRISRYVDSYQGTVGSPGPEFITVLLGNGDGTFNPPISFAYPYVGSELAVADLNSDGIQDLIVVGESLQASGPPEGLVTAFLGKGDGTFTSAGSFTSSQQTDASCRRRL